MGQTTPERERLARFLIRRMPADEAEPLADRLFVDDELLAEVEDVERDLLDAYAAGELSRAERHDVDVYLMTSDAQREKLRFAFAFVHRRETRQAAGTMRWAAAALIVMALGGGAVWVARLSVENARLRTEAAMLRKQGASVETGPAVVFLLSPVDRSAAEERLEVGSGAATIRLNLAGEIQAGSKADVRVSSASGSPVLDQRAVAARNIGGASYFCVWIPGESMPSGSYTVSAVEPDGRELNYAFRLIRGK